MEQQEDDLDARIRGDLVHNSLGKLFEQVFSLQEGDVRESIGAKSLANSGQSLQSMFGHILEYVAEHAPWLERDDATAAQRRYDLIGLSNKPGSIGSHPQIQTHSLHRVVLGTCCKLKWGCTIPFQFRWSGLWIGWRSCIRMDEKCP